MSQISELDGAMPKRGRVARVARVFTRASPQEFILFRGDETALETVTVPAFSVADIELDDQGRPIAMLGESVYLGE